MPRYAKQRNSYTCGPVAILNAIKWAGNKKVKIDYKELLNYLMVVCFCDPPIGTTHSVFDWVLRYVSKEFFTVRRVSRPTFEQIKKHLKGGGAIILNYLISKEKDYEDRHFFLVVGADDEGVEVVNAFTDGPALQRIPKNMFKFAFLRGVKTDKSFKGWFLTKHD